MILRQCLKFRGLIKKNNIFFNQMYSIQNFCNKPGKLTAEQSSSPSVVPADLKSKYRPFRDEELEEVLDVNEEIFVDQQSSTQPLEEIEHDEFQGLNTERGITGVFEIEDLVEALKRDNAKDIFVVELSKEVNFARYICIVTGNSRRHISAIAQFIRKLYKEKMNNSDGIPKIEGDGSDEWVALDLGNILLHIFSSETRVKYDLESLWSLGSEYDPESNKKDSVVDILEQHTFYLNNMKTSSS